MALLIDGYNLLHVTGIVGRGNRGTPLQRSREALLRFLAASIDPMELPRTTIVFDAAEAPPGLPRVVTHEGMTVRYASGYADADALIEELIEADHAPRALLVVSSDHRIQRAARRRRAQFTDSDVWYAQLHRSRQSRGGTARGSAKPAGDLSSEEVEYWVDEFTSEPDPPSGDLNPFPPGYGDDATE